MNRVDSENEWIINGVLVTDDEDGYFKEKTAADSHNDVDNTAPLPRKSRLTGINFQDMKPHLTDGYLVKGVLARKSIAAIVGSSGAGKTFLATNLALHIAGGGPWHGHRVAGGFVAYFALEGIVSAENRFAGLREHYGRLPPRIPLKLSGGPVNLRDPADVAAVIEFVNQGTAEFGVPAAAVIMDTVARANAGGDENASADMGALIEGVDAIRIATGATVILVHHSGKDESRGARGHSSFHAALDTLIQVNGTSGPRIVSVTKQRDGLCGVLFAFELEPIELGVDAEGDSITTCVLQCVEPDAPPDDRKVPAGKHQMALLSAIKSWQAAANCAGNPNCTEISIADLKALAKAQGIPTKRVGEATDSLVKSGWLIPKGNAYAIP